MNCDCAYYIGNSHKECQDYAQAINNKDNCVVVVADGCSSSIDSDIGARILTKLICNQDNLFDFNLVIEDAEKVSESLSLDYTALDSTVIVASSSDDKKLIRAAIYGDGVIVIKLLEKATKYLGINMISYSVSFPSGYPQYLSYEIDKERKKNFDEADQGSLCEILAYPHSGSNKNLDKIKKISDMPFRQPIPIDLVEYVAIMSDGIHSFYEKIKSETFVKNIPILYNNIIPELLNFKNKKGAFVQRRLNRFLKDCANKNWYHYDDISLAVINLG